MRILQKNQDKIINTKALLMNIIHEPKNYNMPEIKNALMGQRKLAAFSSEKYGITSCALNTLKKAADAILSRGFIELDELRQNAKAELEKDILRVSKPNHNTKEYFKERLKYAEQELDKNKRIIMGLTNVIGDLTENLARIANATNMSNEERQAFYQEVNRKLQHQLSFTLGNR